MKRQISLGVCRSRVLSHVPRMSSLSLPLLVLTAPDRSSWALIGLERSFLCLQLFSSQELAANYHLFCACFGFFLLLRCLSCLLGLAASASLSSSFGVSVSRGFPGFLVRVAWSVPVPGELSCCGVCGGFLCVGGLLACASGVSVFASVVPGALLLPRVPACVGGFARGLGGSFVLCLGVFCLVASAERSLSLGVRSAAVRGSQRGAFRQQVLFSPRCPCRCLPVGLRGVLSVFCPGALGFRLCQM
jgi:hypothetical protein